MTKLAIVYTIEIGAWAGAQKSPGGVALARAAVQKGFVLTVQRDMRRYGRRSLLL